MSGMTDRDHFAAAALTGLLASDNYTRTTTSAEHAAVAYELADAMLRERGKSDYQKNVEWLAPFANLDAAPAARAVSDEDRTDKAATSHRRAGTGDTPVAEPATTAEPVAWCVANGSRVLATSISRIDAVDMQSDYAYHTEIVPLYRSPPVTKPMPKEKRAEVSDRSKPITGPDPDSRVWETHTPATHATPGEGSVRREGTQEPVAWGVAGLGRVLATSISRAGAVDMQSEHACYAEVVPLCRKPTLTDAEREAVEYYIGTGGPKAVDDALRGLLKRLGGGK